VWRRTVSVPVFRDRIFAIAGADVRLERDPLLTLESVEHIDPEGPYLPSPSGSPDVLTLV